MFWKLRHIIYHSFFVVFFYILNTLKALTKLCYKCSAECVEMLSQSAYRGSMQTLFRRRVAVLVFHSDEQPLFRHLLQYTCPWWKHEEPVKGGKHLMKDLSF